MAKFELTIYDTKTGDVEKVQKCNFIPAGLYVRFQALAEKTMAEDFGNDEEMFKQVEPLFLEAFHGLTSEEYWNKTDIAEVLKLYAAIINKATTIENSKNA